MLLTSSQLRLSFVIAAAHNRPLDFFDRISELWPVIGSAFGFRGASRVLVKVLPTVGPALRPLIAFGGTYAIGEACRLYYEHGQPTSEEVQRELMRRAHEDGAKEAQRLLRRVLAGQSLEDIEDSEEGDEVMEAVERLTAARQEDSEKAKEASKTESPDKVDKPGKPEKAEVVDRADSASPETSDEAKLPDEMEPTVEMDAVKIEPEPDASKKDEPEAKKSAKADDKDSSSSKAKSGSSKKKTRSEKKSSGSSKKSKTSEKGKKKKRARRKKSKE
jgi:hypothetical protein